VRVETRADGALLIDLGGVTRMVIPVGGPVVPEQSRDDAYPKVISDQREIHHLTAESAAEVHVYWEEYLARQRPPKPIIGTAGRAPELVSVVPYINESRWVADCLNCNGGMACWDQNPSACCLTCGWLFEVNWQPPAERSEIVRMLAVREAKHRNWDPRKGEDRDFLIRENILMLGSEPVERHGMLVAAGLDVPVELADQVAVLEAVAAKVR